MRHTPNLLDQDFSPADETYAFWTTFLLAFGLVFVVAAVANLIGLRWREFFPGTEKSSGLVPGVKAAVYTLMSRVN